MGQATKSIINLVLLATISLCALRYQISIVNNIYTKGSIVAIGNGSDKSRIENRNGIYNDYAKEFSGSEEKRELVMVHLGKTAGSTVTCMLGPSLNGSGKGDSRCDPSDFRPSAISDSVVKRVHLDPAPVDDFDDFLITLRNPVDRIISWFYYIHPKYPPKKLPRHRNQCDGYEEFFECYDSIEALGEDGLASGGDDVADSCRVLAMGMVSGKRKCWHNYYNYNFTYGSLLHHKLDGGNITIYAIRTEHLEEDWDVVDRMLGGSRGKTANATVVSSPHKNKWEEKGLSPNKTLSFTGRSNLCRALCNEIQIYKGLLRLADSINAERQKESLNELLLTCPEERREIRMCTETGDDEHQTPLYW